MPTKPPSQAPALRPEPGPESSAWARTPFDDVQADLIVRSSDGVQFRVFKIILSLASTVFADMFSVPLPTSPDLHDDDDSDEVVQVVPVSERSEDLDLFLRHLYPVPPPDTVPLKSVGILAEFARKYQVDALEESIMQYLTNYVDHDPVGVYAIAVQYEHKGIAADAARACLNLPFSRLQSPCLQYATVQHMSELFGYYAACAEAACAIASKRKWLYPCVRDGYYYSTRVGAQQTCQSCNTPDFINRVSGSQGKKYGPRWLWSYLHRSALMLARHPTAGAVTSEEFVLKANDCPSCPQYTRQYMLHVSEIFGKEIKEAVQHVPLPKAVIPNPPSMPHPGPPPALPVQTFDVDDI